MREQQMTLSPSGFERFRKVTRREQFLAEMERVVPWADLYAVIEPHYPKVEGAGRPTVGLAKMLRMYLVAQWFDLTDPGAEEAIYDLPALRAFVGIDLGREPVPDETTLCKFRHLLESQGLGTKLFTAVNHHLQAQGLKIGRGTIVDATIIAAPPPRPRTGRKSATPRCARRRRATSGTSA